MRLNYFFSFQIKYWNGQNQFANIVSRPVEVLFQFGEMKMPFTAEGFLLSFSIPNLHFHATTAYDILRMKGVPLGKRDYMGQPRLKG